ncbi:MAG TPA: FtsX-like permease family protein [Aggregatilineaceae bacterium]|nr:FtsX-like permease family protein [Aggregatilineaceae bacterium]
MFKTRSKKVFRDILARKGRSFMVILSIMFGVFGVSTMTSITDLLNRQLKEDVKSEQISHTKAYVISGGESITAEENQTYLETLQSLPGVVDVEGQAVYPVVWQQGDKQGDAVMFAFSEPFGQGNRETVSRIIKGRYPEAGEIAVEPRFAEATDLGIGDKLRFPNTGDEEWEIVGILLDPYYTEFPATQTTILVEQRIFANYEDARRIVGFSGLSAIHVRYESTSQSIEKMDDLITAINRETPYVVYYTYQDTPEDDFMSSMTAEMTGAMDALGFVAMIVSGFLVTNVMNTVILEQRRQIGAMKALGATLTDNFRIYTGMALTYGIIGTVLGLLLAVPVSANTARPVASWLGAYIEGYKLSPLGLGIGAVMGLVVPVLAALVPVWRSARVSILEALTDLGISSNWGQSRLAHRIGRLPLPFSVRQALSNIWHKRGRLALTVLTLTAAVSAFMAATAVVGSLNTVVKDMVGIHDYEIRITPQQAGDYERLAALVREDVEGVEAIYPGLDVLVSVPSFASKNVMRESSDQVPVSGFDPTTPTYAFHLIQGTGWRTDPTRKGIVISRPLADALDKQVGDTLTLMVNNQEHSYEIIGVDAYVFESIFMNWRELARIAGYVDETGQPMVGTVYVMLAGAPSIEVVNDKIDEITALLSTYGIQGTYFNQPKAAEMQAEQTKMLGVIFQMMSVVMAVVGVIGLMAALSMAVFERQKEIGVMRSVGASSRAVMSQFMLEGFLIGLLAWVVAIPISVGMSQGFLGMIPIEYLELVYPPQLVVFGLVGILLVVMLASLWPSLMASRKTVADILRYQ